MTEDQLRILLSDLCNAAFEAGETPANRVLTDHYASLAKTAHDLQTEIITLFNTLNLQLLRAEDAANKGTLARHHAAGLEMENAELRTQLRTFHSCLQPPTSPNPKL